MTNVAATRARQILSVVALAVCYSLVSGEIIERLPFTSMPAWWAGVFGTHAIGVFVWFQVLDAVGSLGAALPVAALVIWAFGSAKLVPAFCVSALAAGYAVVPTITPRQSAMLWANDVALILIIGLAVPAWVLIYRHMPSNYRIERTRDA
jgi:hypothetical protein